MQRNQVLTAAIGGLFAAACAADPSSDGGDASRFDFGVQEMTVGGAGGDGGPGADAGGGLTEERIRLSYIKEVESAEGTVVDLVVYDFTANREANLTNGQASGVNCRAKGCVLNKQMTWVGWMEPAAGVGFDLFVAPVDTLRLIARIDQKRRVATEVHTFEFTTDDARDLIVFSQGEAEGPEGELEVRVEPVAPFDAALCMVPNIDDPSACPQPVGFINGDGAFRVTPFGSLIILIKTTLSTMTLDFFNVSNGASQTLYTFGEQGGTGSEFSGRLPVALSPDSRFLAVFTRNDFIWRVHNLQAVPNPPAPVSLDLFEVEGERLGDCTRQTPFNFNDLRFDPRFSPDAAYFYFLAAGDCSRQEMLSNRDDFDVLRMDKSLDPASVKSVTKNLRASHWANHQIGEFDLSPDGDLIAFTAPRPFDAQSKSVWIVGSDPDEANGPTYNCSRSMPVAGPDGRQRCEFIFEERDGAHVSYRGLSFHRVLPD